ncbi:MAG: hypothetical protein K9N47_07220 [Prosthecobacter sp.]|uniref:hypothetical protein n=1 Tax=Prosthecobacter sp. TaxID=1965333 RepID=UPI0025FCAB95|nr:hypothetical protein [Prosthecobacter sp.]MCF7785895.1 hypothetical protein [Prosthecobacter sp.]
MRSLFCLLFLLVNPLPAQQPAASDRKLETLLLMPEPKAMRGAYSITLPNSQQTVLTCYRESTAALSGVETYSVEAFTKLGLSVESFAARAKTAADKRLLQLKPDLIKGEDGRIAYAVYRGESPLYATLLIAPSLPKIFAELFGQEIWVVTPDRHSLYIFPAKAELLEEFAADLAERYATDAYAASCEIFSIKAGAEPRVVATFGGEDP